MGGGGSKSKDKKDESEQDALKVHTEKRKFDEGEEVELPKEDKYTNDLDPSEK